MLLSAICYCISEQHWAVQRFHPNYGDTSPTLSNDI